MPCAACVSVSQKQLNHALADAETPATYKNTRDDVALFIILPLDTLFSDKVIAPKLFCIFDNILSNIVTTSSRTTLTFSSFKIIYTLHNNKTIELELEDYKSR